MNHLFNLLILVTTGIFSYLLTLFLIHFGNRYQLLDYPTQLKRHKNPTPYLGGVSIFISFWAVVYLGIQVSTFFRAVGLFSDSDETINGIIAIFPNILPIFFGSLIILIIGLLDDRYKWSPVKKFLGQVLAVTILIGSGFKIDALHDFGWLAPIVSAVWALILINAFNFIDSLDGHCAGVALISSLIFFSVTQITNQPLEGFLFLAFAGTLLGFLSHNFPRGKIFLGDNGSLLIGYMFAAFTLICNFHTNQVGFAGSFIPILVFGIPIYDMISVVIARLLRGIPPWKGDRNHFAHWLVNIGMNSRAAVLFSYFITFTLGHLAILLTQVARFGVVTIGILFVSIMSVIAFLEFYIARKVQSSSLAQQSHQGDLVSEDISSIERREHAEAEVYDSKSTLHV